MEAEMIDQKKPAAGRPRRRDVRVCLRVKLPEQSAAAVRRIAETEDRPLATVARRLLERALVPPPTETERRSDERKR